MDDILSSLPVYALSDKGTFLYLEPVSLEWGCCPISVRNGRAWESPAAALVRL